ncbi:hypothetical protein H1C71_007026 [Ictidomys tridecemlineatus]|nr:hypothetical protein H1C71_007026 [Ictidomys tridecemlineatus]
MGPQRYLLKKFWTQCPRETTYDLREAGVPRAVLTPWKWMESLMSFLGMRQMAKAFFHHFSAYPFSAEKIKTHQKENTDNIVQPALHPTSPMLDHSLVLRKGHLRSKLWEPTMHCCLPGTKREFSFKE